MDGGGGGRCTSGELCFNTDGLANTYVLKELMGQTVAGVPSALHTLACVARHWAKCRGLCGGPNAPNSARGLYSQPSPCSSSPKRHSFEQARPTLPRSFGRGST